MRRNVKEIERYILLQTSELENGEYIDVMREIAEWATSQADIVDYREELSIE
jgi:hypothetical protein